MNGLVDLSSAAGLLAGARQSTNADTSDWLACAGRERRTMLTLGADELLPGDLMRDQGIVREVVQVSPSVVEWAIRVVFCPLPGRSRGLTVPLFVPVVVWRVTGDG